MCAGLIAPLEDPSGEGEVNIEEETEPLRAAPDPKQPSAEQVEAHRTTGHIPYRTWCKHCIMGRGLGEPHRQSGPSELPRVGIDYFFITAGGVKKRAELDDDLTEDSAIEAAREKGTIVKCIFVRCWDSKCVFAHVVPKKGADEESFTAKLVAADIEWLGHTKLVIKADNEPAVKALAKQVEGILRERGNTANVQQESPPAYDSQANGGTEVGIRIVRGLFRTLKLCLEARIGKFVPIGHALIPWLLEHTCTLLNAKLRGNDGLTAWGRIRGRTFNQRLLGFAETVLYKLPAKGPHSAPDGNMGTRWLEGCFLGFHRSSNTYIIGTPQGTVTARALMRRPIENRWKAEAMSQLTATPWSERDRPEPTVRFEQGTELAEEAPQRAVEPVPKQFRINYSDLRTHGFTDDCPQCRYAEVHKKSKGGIGHSEACRKRILEAIAGTAAGSARIDSYEERVDQAIADRIESTEKARQTAEEAAQPRPEAMTPAEAARQEQPARHELGTARTNSASASHEQTPGSSPVAPGADPRPRGLEQQSEAPPMGQANTEVDVDTDEQVTEDMDVGFLGSLEPEIGDVVSDMILQQLGSQGRKYRRESRSAYKALVSEIYSPPRVTQEIRQQRHRHLLPGFAFDLTVVDPEDGQPWDFSRRDKREKARAMLRRQRPLLLIGSPMCTAFSTWQYLNLQKSQDAAKILRNKVKATLHMDFVLPSIMSS